MYAPSTANAAHRHRQISPSRPRGVRRGRAAVGANHRHRSYSGGLRNNRARALGLRIPTILEKQHGQEIRALAAAGKGFGIVAGTGTGKTLSIRPMAETILGTDALKVGVVNREREATPETPTWNVIVVTTGIARRWFQDGDILPTDTLVVDEIHQTSAELELCLALGKRVGCRFIWLSATVDPTFYARYLNAAAVLETSAFDPAKAADVKIVRKDPRTFLDDRFLQQVVKERRGSRDVPPNAGGSRGGSRGGGNSVSPNQRRFLSRWRADQGNSPISRGAKRRNRTSWR